MHQIRAQAIETAIMSRFASPLHKLAVLGLLGVAHVTDDSGLAFFDSGSVDACETIQNAARCTMPMARALFDDLRECGAVGEPIGTNGKRALIWPRAID